MHIEISVKIIHLMNDVVEMHHMHAKDSENKRT